MSVTEEATAADEATADNTGRRARVSKADRVTAFRTSEGRCHVFGTECDPHEGWTVDEDGVLLSARAKKLKGGRALEEFRQSIFESTAKKRKAVSDARERLERAQKALEEHRETYAGVLDEDESNGAINVVFAGEL